MASTLNSPVRLFFAADRGLAVALCLIAGAAISTPASANEGEGCAGRLNFDDVEIGLVVDDIARRTGKRFIIDPRVVGRITISSPAEGGLCAEDALDLFLAALPANGFKATPVMQDAFRISPAEAASGPGSAAARASILEPASGAAEMRLVPPSDPSDDRSAVLEQDPIVLAAASASGPPRRPTNASIPSSKSAIQPFEMESVFYGAHLASYRGEAAAIAGWNELLAEHPLELDALSPRLANFDDPARGAFKRVIAGPFSSKDDASTFCGKLKATGAYCAVMPFAGRPLDDASPSGE